MQVFDGIKDIYNGVSQTIEGANPFVTTMDNETNQAIAAHLLDQGFTKEQILDFIDVSRIQAERWLTVEEEVMKRMAQAKRTNSRPAKKA